MGILLEKYLNKGNNDNLVKKSMPHDKVAVNYKKITDMRMEIKNDDDKVKTLVMFSSKEVHHILLSGCVK